jgi:N-terminal domain of anti-restriction factor ArdC
MANKSRRRMSEQERDERRRADRERLQHAAEELLSSEGWARWVRVRASFHSYSAGNCMLLAWQCHERGIVPERIAGFRAWLKLGRSVRKGERALRILAPVTVKSREEHGEESDERRVFFKTASVFELSQTEPLPGVDPVPLHPPREPLTGDSHVHLLAPLQAFAESVGYSVSFEAIPGAVGGWCDASARQIVVDADAPANAQVRTLIHECAHAAGIDYQSYSRSQAEVMVDTVSLLVASALGLAVDGETIPYVAGWGETGALEAVTEFAQLIDTLARRLEAAITPTDDVETAQEAFEQPLQGACI